MTKETKPDAWMPLYIGDYKKDTGRLTRDQHGAYLLLIMEYWSTGPLADDDQELAAIVLASVREWRKSLRPKLARFFIVVDGLWRHKRIDEELERWSERKAAYARRARAGGKAKAAKSNASSTSKALLETCTSSPVSEVESPNRLSTLRERERAGERADGSPAAPAFDVEAYTAAVIANLEAQKVAANGV